MTGMSLERGVGMVIILIALVVLIGGVVLFIANKYPEMLEVFKRLEPGSGLNEHNYIFDFDASRVLGRNITISWKLMEDDDIEYYDLSYNDSDGIIHKFDLTNKQIVLGSNVLDTSLPSYKTHTVNITVYGEEGIIDSDFKIIDFQQGMDDMTFTDFTAFVDTYINYHLFEQNEDSKTYPHYWLKEGYVLVGFNSGETKEACGLIHNDIKVPDECAAKTCLCLCHKGGKLHPNSCKDERLCVGFNVDYIITDPNTAGVINPVYSGADMPSGVIDEIINAKTMVQYGQCWTYKWNNQVVDLTVKKIDVGGKTVLNIIGNER